MQHVGGFRKQEIKLQRLLSYFRAARSPRLSLVDPSMSDHQSRRLYYYFFALISSPPRRLSPLLPLHAFTYLLAGAVFCSFLRGEDNVPLLRSLLLPQWAAHCVHSDLNSGQFELC